MTRTSLLTALFTTACTVVPAATIPAAPVDDNLTPDTAAPAAIGAAIDGTVHAGHARYYALGLHAGDTLAVDARARVMESTYGNLEYDLELVDAGGARIAASSLVPANARDPEWDPYTWTAKVAADGTYYLRVHDANSPSYPKTLQYHLALTAR